MSWRTAYRTLDTFLLRDDSVPRHAEMRFRYEFTVSTNGSILGKSYGSTKLYPGYIYLLCRQRLAGKTATDRHGRFMVHTPKTVEKFGLNLLKFCAAKA